MVTWGQWLEINSAVEMEFRDAIEGKTTIDWYMLDFDEKTQELKIAIDDHGSRISEIRLLLAKMEELQAKYITGAAG